MPNSGTLHPLTPGEPASMPLASVPLADRWRLLLTPPLSGARNMAVDVWLMARARQTGEAVFRIYTWATPTLSFGRNQTAVGRYDIQRIRAHGIDVVRRPTGGRAILHYREITYSVAAPATDAVGLRPSYHRINALLEDGLARLGVAVAQAVPSERASRPTDAPCFAEPSAGEMTAQGRKLVGSAQWRDTGALLQHGSILIDDDQSMLASLMVSPPPPVPPPATLRDTLGYAPSADQVARAMFDAVRASEDQGAVLLPAEEVVSGSTAEEPLFLSEEWTWRR